MLDRLGDPGMRIGRKAVYGKAEDVQIRRDGKRFIVKVVAGLNTMKERGAVESGPNAPMISFLGHSPSLISYCA